MYCSYSSKGIWTQSDFRMFKKLTKKKEEKNVVCAYKMLYYVLNKAKSIRVELLQLNLKKKLEETWKTK